MENNNGNNGLLSILTREGVLLVFYSPDAA
jgi:hypothetical protein